MDHFFKWLERISNLHWGWGVLGGVSILQVFQGWDWSSIYTLSVLGAASGVWLLIGIKQLVKMQSTVEFFPDREAMERRAPLSKIFCDGNEIHGHFLSGEGVFSKYPSAYKYLKRLILANPQCGLAKDAQRLAYNKHQDTVKDIHTVTQNAPAKIVRWFDHATGMGLLFCNPELPGAWVHIELAVPFLEASQKLGIRIEKEQYPEVFKRLYDAYGKTWDDSKET